MIAAVSLSGGLRELNRKELHANISRHKMMESCEKKVDDKKSSKKVQEQSGNEAEVKRERCLLPSPEPQRPPSPRANIFRGRQKGAGHLSAAHTGPFCGPLHHLQQLILSDFHSLLDLSPCGCTTEQNRDNPPPPLTPTPTQSHAVSRV